jgi:cyclic beta-1,2-glucan synthetase
VLVLAPCIPKAWPRFEIFFNHLATRYEIEVDNSAGVSRGVAAVELDGEPNASAIVSGEVRLPLVDDALTHRLRVTLGAR